ncbi:MAG: YqcC family protein [Saprospiraceae bacterium]
MPGKHEVLNNQINLIQNAMKKAGVWSTDTPDWIHTYPEVSNMNVWQWLQFIHLPMRLNKTIKKSDYLAPRISEHIKDNPERQRILQLIIELDSITSTF